MKKSVPSSPSKDGTQHLMRKTPSTRSLQSLQPIQPLSQLHQSPHYNNNNNNDNDNNYKNNNNTNNNTNNGTFSNPISTRPSLRLNSPQTSQASFTPHHYQHAQSTQYSHTFHYEPDRERSTTLSSLDIPFHSVEREHRERSKSKVSNHDDTANGTTSDTGTGAGTGAGAASSTATNTGIGHSTTLNNVSSAERAERAANRTYSAPQQPSRPKISRNRSATLPAFTHFEPIRMNDTMHTLGITDDDQHQHLHQHQHQHLHMHPQTHQPLHSPKIRSQSSLKALAFNHPESPTWLLSDLISNLSSLKDRDERYIVQISNDLVHLFQTYPKLEDEVQIRTVLPRILFMLYHPVSEVRSSCYRILRHLIVSYESLIILLQLKILIFIIVSMSNDQSGQTLIEMEQALKLVRKFLTINKGADLLSVGVVKALIAIVQCNDPDDHKGSTITSNYAVRVDTIPEGFKNACLETICEIALVKPELVFHGGGFKLIIDSVIDSSFEVSSTCLLIVLRLLNFQNSRKFLRNGFDLDSLIAIFSTDESLDTKKSSHFSAKIRKASTFKLQKVSFLISGLLKDFNGLMAFSINNFTSINNLLLNLNKRNYRVQNSILDIILDALRIQVFPWLQSGPIGDFVSRFNDLKQLQLQNEKRNQKPHKQMVGNEQHYFPFKYGNKCEPFIAGIVNHYQGLLAYIFIINGVFDHLLKIIDDEEADEALKKKAILLLRELYTMANTLIPFDLVKSQLQSPNLASHAFLFVTETKMGETLKDLNLSTKHQLKDINAKAHFNPSDDELKSMIARSKILIVKDFQEWNWNILQQIIEGPLTNPKKFDEILEKTPKVLKRLMSFYRPFKYRFSNVSAKSSRLEKYISVGCLFFKTLMSTGVGLKYLSMSKFLPQMSEILAQIDPYSGIYANDAILGKRRVENTASLNYLQFLGVLSSTVEGVNLLASWQIFTSFYNIIASTATLESNNLIVINLFKYVSFDVEESQFKKLLQMSLTVSNLRLRQYLLKHVLPKLFHTNDFDSFCIEMSVNSLYDSNSEIVSRSIAQLYKYYESIGFDTIGDFATYRPPVHILANDELGADLLIKCLSTTRGLVYLLKRGFITFELGKWMQIKNFRYARKLDYLIRQQFFPFIDARTVDLLLYNEYDSNENLSLQFFENLLTTQEGLNFLLEGSGKNFIDRLISSTEIIFNQINLDDEFQDIDNQDEIHSELLYTLKQNLWIIGQISSARFGIQLFTSLVNSGTNFNSQSSLDSSPVLSSGSIIDTIIANFHCCPLWEIRGLCFYVIGQISKNIEGAKLLKHAGWVSMQDEYGQRLGLAFPKPSLDDIGIEPGIDKANLFNVEIVNPYRDTRYYYIFNSLLEKNTEEVLLPVQLKVINNLQELNAILSKIELKSLRELTRLKKLEQSMEIFDDINLFLEVVRTIDKGNFSFHKRVFIFKLFTEKTKVMENILKKERRNSIRAQV